MDRESYLRMLLADLHTSYQAEAAPIIREIAKIEAMKPPSPIVFFNDERIRHHLTELVWKPMLRAQGVHFPGDPPQWPQEVRVGRPSR